MRLWHTKLIEALPKQHLVAQWREISAIAGAIQKNGTPNHILVNFVIDYDFDHLISYAHYIRQEMTKRNIKTMDRVWNKITQLKSNYKILPLEEVYPEKMDNEYLTICFYNLYEKYLCGMFDSKDFMPIENIWINQINQVS